MIDGDHRPDIFDTFPKEIQATLRATTHLGMLLTGDCSTRIAESDATDYLGQLALNTEDSALYRQNLSVHKEASLEQQGYLYLRTLADIILGQTLKLPVITYPHLGHNYYANQSDAIKTGALTNLLAVRELLYGKALAAWEPSVLAKVPPVPEWKLSAQDKLDKLTPLLEDEAFTKPKQIWLDTTYAEVNEIMESYR